MTVLLIKEIKQLILCVYDIHTLYVCRYNDVPYFDKVLSFISHSVRDWREGGGTGRVGLKSAAQNRPATGVIFIAWPANQIAENRRCETDIFVTGAWPKKNLDTHWLID